MKKYTLRKLFNDVHLWLGIVSGLVLFVVCLTGTIYTFREEVEELMSPEKYTVEVPANAQPVATNALIAQLEQELQGKVVSISILEDKSSTYSVGVAPAAKEGGKKAEGGRPATYFVNPYTGQVVGTPESATSEFFGTVMRLHRWLLIEGDVGKIIVGVSTIIFTFLVLTGLVLWFPVKRKNWKQGLKIKTNAKWKRVNHDLHNTLGFYSSILLLIMALTGLCWSFEWYRDGLSSVMGAEVFKGRKEKPATIAPAPTTATPQDYIQQANLLLPHAGDLRLSLPADDTTAVVVQKSQAGFFALAASDKVQLNKHNAEPLKVEKFSDKPLNEQVVSLIKPLHLGNVYGTFSKILYFIACLIATSLPVTGTLIWINKLRKKKKPGRVIRTGAATVAS
ncbi:PepSY-associated TM helix domain-containing protein [Pontibacter anaerobius]|uniref:PepSY-associated TM helix domain-containing protein n=1 Tax=Pontibacter anaerobius TaxID=2993940 RepID=A0ABT3RHF9_9BACT|nr:PepSY-associated TM helix domain-containing protein [Pontibacter anaerobius]MCX2741239.1 PepSY-associated TM helix domain-containing protein [Pontibacter anaerobius]